MIDRRQGIFDEYRSIISRLQWLLDGVVVVLLLFLICWLCGESFRLIFQVLGLVSFLLTIMVFQATQLSQPARRQHHAPGAPGFSYLAGGGGHPHDAGLHQQDLGEFFPDRPPHLDGDRPRGPGGSAASGFLGLAVAAAAGAATAAPWLLPGPGTWDAAWPET